MIRFENWWWKFKIRLFGKRFKSMDIVDGVEYTIHGLCYKGRKFFTGERSEEIPKVKFSKLYNPNKFGEELNENKKN